MPNIYKLKYENKDQAIADLLAKNIYTRLEDQLTYGEGIHAVVELGVMVLENAIIDEQGNVIKESVVDNGYHVDVMSENEIFFGEKDITSQVKDPKHSFYGFG
jgi:hypothetical protein